MSDLKSNFVKGVIYTGAAKYCGIFVGIIISAILARLLSPSEFGVVAIATVVLNFFSILTTVGISPAIVQNKTISNGELKTINSFTLILALFVTLLFLCSVPFISNFYDNESDLPYILLLLSVSVFFSIASIVPNALIFKNKQFKYLAWRTLCFQIILGIISVVCAFAGCGVYALLINPIGTAVLICFLSYCKYPIGFSFKNFKIAINKILNFSLYQSLFNLIYLIYRNIDKVFISHYWGMAALGYYEKSYRLMMMPLENVSSIISPVLHPILSEYQNEQERIWKAYIQLLSFLSEFSFPLSVLFYFIAGPIIRLLYGESWLPAIPIFKILSLSICLQLMQSPIGAVLQAINKVKALFLGSVWIFVAILLLMPFAVMGDNIVYVAYVIDIAFLIGFVAYQYNVSLFFEKKVSEIFSVISRNLYYSIFLFLLCQTVSWMSDMYNAITELLIYSLITILMYSVLLYYGMMPETKKFLKGLYIKFKNIKHVY